MMVTMVESGRGIHNHTQTGIGTHCIDKRTMRIMSMSTLVITSNLYFSCVCLDGLVVEPDLSTVFCPDHKAAMVLFLDRVYGIEDQSLLLHLLQVGFLPDLQAAVSLDTVSRENYILLPCSPAWEIQCNIVGVTSD